MPRQRRNILPPLAQGRNTQRHHREPIEQILPEAPGGDFGLQIAIGGGNDPHIHIHPGRAANAGKTLILQRAHDLALGFQRHIRHLIEQQRAAMGTLQHASTARPIGRGFDAEKLFLDPRRVHRGAIDRDKGAIHPAGACMDHPRHHLLARTGRARDEHA